MVATTDIIFLPAKKYILIHPFPYSIASAIQGNNYVDVNEVISSQTPQSATLVLGKTCAQVAGSKDLSGGYDWSSSPENFKMIAGACVGDMGFDNLITITLDANCSDIDAVVAHINSKFTAAGFALINEAFKVDGVLVCIRNKTGFCGETGAFYLEDGSPNALATLGINEGSYHGTSDVYTYTSWSGSRFNLSSNLTQNYDLNKSAMARRLSYTCLEVYNKAMDWCDEQEGMGYDVPISAVGKAPLGGGIYSDSIFILINGWKIRPLEGDYIITFTGTIITDDGSSKTSNPKTGTIQIVFQVTSQGILSITGSGVTEQDKTDIANLIEAQTGQPIKSKVNLIPSDPTSETSLDEAKTQITEIQNQLIDMVLQLINIENVHTGNVTMDGDIITFFDYLDPNKIHARYKLIKDSEGKLIGREKIE